MIGHLLRDSCNIANLKQSDEYGVGTYETGAAIRCAFFNASGKIIKDAQGRDVVINARAVLETVDTNGESITVNEKSILIFEAKNYEVVNFDKKKNTRMAATHYELFLISSERVL